MLKSLRNLNTSRESHFKNKIKKAIDFGKEWENRDITYYMLHKNLEKAKQEQQDIAEICKAQELKLQKTNSKNRI